MAKNNITPPEWRVSENFEPYPETIAAMEKRVDAIIERRAPELVWLLEHPPLYTAGTSANLKDLLAPDRLPVFTTGRGGKYTYHGPGQRVVYVMRDLREHKRDLRAHVSALEEWIIRTLASFGIKGERREGRVGIWIVNGDREEKIAAIGVRVRKWVTYHGLSLNVNPDLSNFQGIVPCGLGAYGVTSLHALGVRVAMSEIDAAFRATWPEVFNI